MLPFGQIIKEMEDGIFKRNETQHCQYSSIAYDYQVNNKVTTVLGKVNSIKHKRPLNVLSNDILIMISFDILRCAVTM